ncbi:MAG TPA: EAL domain-containing protein [Stellaceae bacterium]|nr:EAL domain-containing protein [Stellaceae bacterium]
MRLLVLDDERGIVTLVAGVAKDRGWTVDTATDEAAFLSRFDENRPDVVMLDLQLGDRDGVEQLRFLAGVQFAGPVILMSGFDERVLTSVWHYGDSLGLRVAAALPKPIRLAHLRDTLAAVERPAEAAAPVREAKGKKGTESTSDLITPAAIMEGLNRGELELFLQPVVDSVSFRPIRFEALTRWRRPVQGLVQPDLFIPVAEQDDATIDALTFWVIDASIALHLRLLAAGYRMPISINVSAGNLRSLDFPDRCASVVERAGVAPSMIVFEITESVATADVRLTTDILNRLRLKGFPLAMDDFGTGYSSLKALQQLPFSELKIDKSFVASAQHSADSVTIVTSVVSLARSLHLECVAEGVETEESAAFLARLGADYLQGYHFNRPLPFDGAMEWLRRVAPQP